MFLFILLLLPSLAISQYRPVYTDEDDFGPDFGNEKPEFAVINPSEFVNSRGPPPRPQNPYIVPEVPQVGVIPEATPPPVPEKPINSYEINFCDRREFPDEVLSTYGLQRLDYFIYNTTCSDIFFQCSIGFTFLLKCMSEAQAFDNAISSCNHKNDVKFCPEYDHVLHCTIRDSCSDMEFACCSLPQQCLSLTKRCDGHTDCSDGDDENNCPSCAKNEFACVKSGSCISSDKRCDGIADDCDDGSNMDELGCDRNSTCVGKFMCAKSLVGSSCVEWTQHCDGQKDCYMGEDEMNCKSIETEKYLLCENQKQSVRKAQWCNGEAECADSSDEKYCS